MTKRACRRCGDIIPYAHRRRRYCSDWCRDQASADRLAGRCALADLLTLIEHPGAILALDAISPDDRQRGTDALRAVIVGLRHGR